MAINTLLALFPVNARQQFNCCLSFLFSVCCLVISVSCSDSGSSKAVTHLDNEHLAGGDATVHVALANAFERHSNNLQATEKIRMFNLGNDFFQNPWVPNRSSTSMRDGLGPLFNNNACQNCHIRDGRGHAPDDLSASLGLGHDFSSMLIRAVKSDITPEQRSQMLASLLANVGDSAVGGQLQHQSNLGVRKESELRVTYQAVSVSFDDGYTVELRKPVWHLTSGYSAEGHDFDSDTVFSARVAPPMIGLGLLALIDDNDILQRADPMDRNKDGISGKANYVWDISAQKVALGRLGWKAGQPSLRQQAAGAFLGDMGLTSALFPTENCLPHQADCLLAPHGNGDSVADYSFEVSEPILDAVSFYSAHLAVPARRNAYDPQVQQGKRLFNDAGCVACHVAQYTTGHNDQFPELSGQIIFPYTDLLLHDMGPELADFTLDNQVADQGILFEFLAGVEEWRTPPLWGLGMTKVVDPEATFLHDGRARTIMEAILWHGGEAQKSKDIVLSFSREQREALLAFLNDL